MALPKLLALLSTKGNFCHSRLFSQSGHAVPSEAQIGGGSSLQAMLCVLLCLWWGEVRRIDSAVCWGPSVRSHEGSAEPRHAEPYVSE